MTSLSLEFLRASDRINAKFNEFTQQNFSGSASSSQPRSQSRRENAQQQQQQQQPQQNQQQNQPRHQNQNRNQQRQQHPQDDGEETPEELELMEYRIRAMKSSLACLARASSKRHRRDQERSMRHFERAASASWLNSSEDGGTSSATPMSELERRRAGRGRAGSGGRLAANVDGLIEGVSPLSPRGGRTAERRSDSAGRAHHHSNHPVRGDAILVGGQPYPEGIVQSPPSRVNAKNNNGNNINNNVNNNNNNDNDDEQKQERFDDEDASDDNGDDDSSHINIRGRRVRRTKSAAHDPKSAEDLADALRRQSHAAQRSVALMSAAAAALKIRQGHEDDARDTIEEQAARLELLERQNMAAGRLPVNVPLHRQPAHLRHLMSPRVNSPPTTNSDAASSGYSNSAVEARRNQQHQQHQQGNNYSNRQQQNQVPQNSVADLMSSALNAIRESHEAQRNASPFLSKYADKAAAFRRHHQQQNQNQHQHQTQPPPPRPSGGEPMSLRYTAAASGNPTDDPSPPDVLETTQRHHDAGAGAGASAGAGGASALDLIALAAREVALQRQEQEDQHLMSGGVVASVLTSSNHNSDNGRGGAGGSNYSTGDESRGGRGAAASSRFAKKNFSPNPKQVFLHRGGGAEQ